MKPGKRDARRRVCQVDAEQQGQDGIGKLLTSVPDLHSHRLMGWAMALQMPATLVCTALANADCKCRLVPRHSAASLAVRSGWEAFVNVRKGHGIKSAMGQRENCWTQARQCLWRDTARLAEDRTPAWKMSCVLAQATDEAIACLPWCSQARLHLMLAYFRPMRLKSAWLASQANPSVRLWDVKFNGKGNSRFAMNTPAAAQPRT